ncbi:MAG: hypothetical protein KC729_16240, partial [Candidatus Eisenbacteria bacterium]|nr:hypothetical protein [Candidatus Eisenbacteria bacterium]
EALDKLFPGLGDSPMGETLTIPETARGTSPLVSIGSWPFGSARATAADEDRQLLFYGMGGVVRTLDISDPANPTVVTDDLHTGGLVQELCYDGANQHLLVAAGRGGLEIWDVANPAAPTRLSVTEVIYAGVEAPAVDVDLSDGIAYVAADFGLVHIFDISNPAAPVDLGITGVPDCKHVVIHEPYLYATGHDFGRFEILGPGDIRHLSQESNIAINASVGEVVGARAYVVKNGDILILDLTSAFFPVIGSYSLSGYSFTDLQAQGLDLYAGDAGDGFLVLNLSSPTSPSMIGSYAASGARTVQIVGVRAYTTWAQSADIVDISDPTLPSQIGENIAPASSAYDAEAQDGLVYVADSSKGFFVLDASDPASPFAIGNTTIPGLPLDVTIDGSYAFVASQFEGLQVVDVSDPTNPVVVGSHATPDYARGVDVVGNLAYVADLTGGLLIYDVTDPTDPIEIGSLGLPQGADRVTVENGIAYCATGSDGLRIVDVSDPTLPALLGGLGSTDFTVDSALHGDYLLQANFGGGMRVVDVSNPTHPLQVATFDPPGIIAWGISVHGDIAFLSSASNELFALDVSDPTNPVLLDSRETVGDAFQSFPDGGRTFVADGSAGVAIYQYLQPASTDEGDPVSIGASGVVLRMEGHAALFQLPQRETTLGIYDARGRSVLRESGQQTVRFDPGRSGVYFWKASGDSDGTQTGRVVIVR